MLLKFRKKTADRQPPTREISRRALAILLLICIIGYGVPFIFAQSGNIGNQSIEIDNNANLFPGDGNANIKNPGAAADWVKDSLVNTDVDTDPNDSVAVGITPNVTGAAGGTGHWNGVRVVDGVAGGDQDIFLTGGKENDTSSWNVGAGSVGSSKYDITQAYIANNQQYIFFGMERRGNNGTTAFDFEFNQVGTSGGYVPTRTVGDVLITFEMQGSGGSGSASPHVYFWNGTTYVEQALGGLPSGLVTSINNTTVAPAPWGYVNSNGNWVLSPDLPRFEFAEAQVPLSILPGVNTCGGAAFVQVRTRSSSTPNSDLKDTTKIFEYLFGGPDAGAQLTPRCDLTIDYDGSASRNSNGGTTGLAYSWQFQKLSGGVWANVSVTGNTTLVSGSVTVAAAGTYRAILTITENGACADSVTTNEVSVFTAVSVTPVITPDCDDTFGYSATPAGGSGSYTFTWTYYKMVSGNPVLAKTVTDSGASSSGTLDVDSFNAGANGDGTYRVLLQINDSNSCPFSPPEQQFDVRHALTVSVSKSGTAVPAGMTDIGFTATLTGTTNALAGDTIGLQWQRNASGTWTNVGGATGTTLTWTLADLITYGTVDTTGSTQTILGESYKLNRVSLESRLNAVRTVNGNPCEANSSAIFVRGIKAIDP